MKKRRYHETSKGWKLRKQRRDEFKARLRARRAWRSLSRVRRERALRLFLQAILEQEPTPESLAVAKRMDAYMRRLQEQGLVVTWEGSEP